MVLLCPLLACAGATKRGTLPVCASSEACRAYDNQRVQIVGEYTLWDPRSMPAGVASQSRQVRLMFGPEEGGPFLGAWGRPAHTRSLAEIRRFEGKQVRVTGRFLQTTPLRPRADPRAASLGGSCIHPVERIVLDE